MIIYIYEELIYLNKKKTRDPDRGRVKFEETCSLFHSMHRLQVQEHGKCNGWTVSYGKFPSTKSNKYIVHWLATC